MVSTGCAFQLLRTPHNGDWIPDFASARWSMNEKMKSNLSANKFSQIAEA